MKVIFALMLGLVCTWAAAAEKVQVFPVKKIAGQYYVSVYSLPGVRVFEDSARQRILVEGKSRDQKAFFLWGSSYAVVENRFYVLESPPIKFQGEILLPADFVREQLLDWLAPQPVPLQVAALPDPSKNPELSKPVESARPIAHGSNKSSSSLDKGAAPANKGIPPANLVNNPSSANGVAQCNQAKSIEKIFLDPGHGGSDLGASFRGVFEKDVTLRFSQLMADELRRLGFKVAYSRTKDVFLPLDIRSQLAREWGADLFISIHMNSAKESAAHGTETYILSTDSTDNEARKLALSENSIVKEMPNKADPLRDILWDMEQTQYLQLSAHLASFLHKSIMRSSEKKLRNRGVRQAPFFVLSRAPMPAVLLEIGYLSNSKDRELLTNQKNQITLAKALSEGVKNYASFCAKRR